MNINDKNKKLWMMGEEYQDVQWNANYDGRIAKIQIQTIHNGEREQYKAVLTNDDLFRILDIPRNNIPLFKRLSKDFPTKRAKRQPRKNKNKTLKKLKEMKNEQIPFSTDIILI